MFALEGFVKACPVFIYIYIYIFTQRKIRFVKCSHEDFIIKLWPLRFIRK